MPSRMSRPEVGSGTAAKETAQQPLNADSFFVWLPIDIRKSRMLQYSQIANGGSNDKKPRHTGSGHADGEQE